MIRRIRRPSAFLPLTLALVALLPVAARAMALPGFVPAVQVDAMDVTLLADKPTVVKLTKGAVGFIRVTAKTLRTKVGTQEQLIDFSQTGAFVFVHEAAGPKKMAAAYFMMPAIHNAATPFMDVELDGPDQARGARFACLLPTSFDNAKGVTFNVQVESAGAIRNCASADKGFKVAFEYNVKPAGQ